MVEKKPAEQLTFLWKIATEHGFRCENEKMKKRICEMRALGKKSKGEKRWYSGGVVSQGGELETKDVIS